MTRERLPLIDPASGSVVAVLHKSLINDYLVKRGRAILADLTTATLKQLLDDPDVGSLAKESFVLIPNSATLADTKEAMMRKQVPNGVNCEDAFVTAPGGSKVEGWITNDIISQHAQV